MNQTEPWTGTPHRTKPLRRILVIVGIALLGGLLAAAAIYAAAFVMLAPMMQ
ncbi:MAG: hypothetical protein AB7G47_21805 [Mycolicibacterium sp.]|uniref:hypothetical protein n=1 Tax=Mycolicibacterium sp. TaxID=2320850 RepID=UPI003D0982A4